MVATHINDTGTTAQSIRIRTRMRVVHVKRNRLEPPSPPISPATSLWLGNNTWCFQLQFDFTAPLQPTAEELAAKGIADRDSFLQQVGDPAKYANMRNMARKYIVQALNKSQTMKGLTKIAEEALYEDFLHETIFKVCTLLESGSKKNNNLCGYCYMFITRDASRYVQKIDKANQGLRIQDDEDDDSMEHSNERSLDAVLCESPTYMEGSAAEFAAFAKDYVFDWVLMNCIKTEDDRLSASLFRLYYGTTDKLKDISHKTGYPANVISKASRDVLEYVVSHLPAKKIREAFERKIMEKGCACD